MKEFEYSADFLKNLSPRILKETLQKLSNRELNILCKKYKIFYCANKSKSTKITKITRYLSIIKEKSRGYLKKYLKYKKKYIALKNKLLKRN